MTLDRKSAKPMYIQLYEYYRKQIMGGKLPSGEFLPPETRLMKEYGISRNTVRLCQGLLLKEGLISRMRGCGTRIVYDAESGAAALQGKAIAVLLFDVRIEFFASVIRAIEDTANAEGFRVILCNTDKRPEKEEEYLEQLAGKVAGFIVAPVPGGKNNARYRELIKRKIPVIFIDRFIPGLDITRVTGNNAEGGYAVTKHLLGLGHRRIGVIGESPSSSTDERIKGYRRALDECGIKADRGAVLLNGAGKDELYGKLCGYNRINDLLSADNPPTAVFCLNDDIAEGAYERIKDKGLDIPGDISVAGFDDSPVSGYLSPGLTTVSQQKREMGRKTCEVLIGRIGSSGSPRVNTGMKEFVFPVNMVIRGSTGRVS